MFKLRHQVPKFEQLRSVMLWPMKAKFEHVFLFVDTVPNYEQKWWFIKGCSNLGAAANFLLQANEAQFVKTVSTVGKTTYENLIVSTKPKAEHEYGA